MNKPEVLLMGTLHLAMEPDIVNHQKENIHEVVEALKAFHPTKIAVEKPFLIEEELDRKFAEYNEGNLIPSYDEVEQFAFPLAHYFELPALHPIDEIVDMSKPTLNQVFEWAKEHQTALFKEILDVQKILKEMEDTSSLLTILRSINDPAYISQLQRVYMKLSRVGDRQHQIGVKWLKQWHERDLAISANLSRIAEPNDRILVIIGGDHLHLIRQFLSDSKDFTLSSYIQYAP
ncbi:hypothetical protein GCM10010954_24350 [Halobacillus andaensis]|uniref:Uncharacterized protein n=1 Tax=Halobacillus andaensis TaxID=1176239 RepID=A0A917B745_HALAA|nr:DUF5694 domain-containing protein [Halobacillus andaensis]MBP2005976.1 hypothetical protein [Halobacillus andaensis]GGF24580.1 hypothetical protein GCM10010954_24350 [Halobacillus andaensis]